MLDNTKRRLPDVTGDVLLVRFAPGQQVRLVDNTYGEIVKVGRFYLHITLEGGRTVRVTPDRVSGDPV